jgi:hypothetical protein
MRSQRNLLYLNSCTTKQKQTCLQSTQQFIVKRTTQWGVQGGYNQQPDGMWGSLALSLSKRKFLAFPIPVVSSTQNFIRVKGR